MKGNGGKNKNIEHEHLFSNYVILFVLFLEFEKKYPRHKQKGTKTREV